MIDDVFDMVATVINNGVPLSDNVNEVTFRDQFPFVAEPIQPSPPGKNQDDRTRLVTIMRPARGLLITNQRAGRPTNDER